MKFLDEIVEQPNMLNMRYPNSLLFFCVRYDLYQHIWSLVLVCQQFFIFIRFKKNSKYPCEQKDIISKSEE